MHGLLLLGAAAAGGAGNGYCVHVVIDDVLRVGSAADGEGEQSEGLFGGSWTCAAVGTEHTGEVRGGVYCRTAVLLYCWLPVYLQCVTDLAGGAGQNTSPPRQPFQA
jgi:hypothetical protein